MTSIHIKKESHHFFKKCYYILFQAFCFVSLKISQDQWGKWGKFGPKIAFWCISWVLLYILRIFFALIHSLISIHRWPCRISQISLYCPDILGKKSKFGPEMVFWCISWALLYTVRSFFAWFRFLASIHRCNAKFDTAVYVALIFLVNKTNLCQK